MGMIYTFEPLAVPYLQDLLSYVHVQNQSYNSLSANMLANVNYIKEHGTVTAIDDGIPIVRFALISQVYGGFYVDGEQMKWEFAPDTLYRGQLNYADSYINLWISGSLTGSNHFSTTNLDGYSTHAELLAAIAPYRRVLYPITYRPINCSFANAPTEAAVGDTVVVSVTFPDGYGLVNESNIYVTNNGVVIQSSYSNGQLTFTMPDSV